MAERKLPRKLSRVPTGDQFRWPGADGVLFMLTPETTTFEGKKVARVVYLEPGGLGYAKPGDKGLIPLNADVFHPIERKRRKPKGKR